MRPRYSRRLGIAALLGLGAWGATGPTAALNLVVDVLPPERPVFTTDGTGASPATVTLAAAESKAPPGDKAAIERANALLNGMTTLAADFTQIGGDGRRLTGTVYIARPGKVRFEYDKPSTMEVVSDGTTVLVRDRKLNTSDPYPIGQTPLKFLLSRRIDLMRDTDVKAVASDADGTRITFDDSSTVGGTSKVTLSFSPDFSQLTRWRVVDPQGYTTTVTLANQERNTAIDPKIFMLNYMRPVN